MWLSSSHTHKAAPGWVWRPDCAISRTSASGASAAGPMRQWATSAPSHRADEPPGPQAPGKQARLVNTDRTVVPGAVVRECDVPVPPCSAFRLVSSLSYLHAWPFAVAKATQVCTRNCTSPVAVEEESHRPRRAIRPLGRYEGDAQTVPLPPTSVHVIVWCAETHLLFTGHSTVDASDTSARRAWSARWAASPKGRRIGSEPRGPYYTPASRICSLASRGV